LHAGIMQSRFHQDPMVRASDILLEESLPEGPVRLSGKGFTSIFGEAEFLPQAMEYRVYSGAGAATSIPPRSQILSNNHFASLITGAGNGFISCDGILINRWRPDVLHDQSGLIFYIRDKNTGKYFSVGYHPVPSSPETYRVVFSPSRAEFYRTDQDLETMMEVVVSPQDDLEIRRITFRNRGDISMEIEVTSYLELSIDTYTADLAHPAFSRLFIDSEYVPDRNALIAWRRPRNREDKPKYVIHQVKADARLLAPIEYETDRYRFVGRGNNLAGPEALAGTLPLSSTAGNSTDPALSIRVHLQVPPGKAVTASYITGFCNSREEAMALSYECSKTHTVNDIFQLAEYNTELELKYLDITPRQANAIQDLVGGLYYPGGFDKQERRDAVAKNRRGQSGLWRFGISGDNPVILMKITEADHLGAVKDAFTAYEYLRLNSVPVDLVILNSRQAGYFQELSDLVHDLTVNMRVFDFGRKEQGIFIIQSSHLEPGEEDLLTMVASVCLKPIPRLFYQVQKEEASEVDPVQAAVHKDRSVGPGALGPGAPGPDVLDPPALPLQGEILAGIVPGRFQQDGKEFAISRTIGPGSVNAGNTPMPWINILANDPFGCTVSEAGAGYTWSGNSREQKLTAWSNDPVTDPPSEYIILTDPVTGAGSSPASLPLKTPGNYETVHGYGYSTFRHVSGELGADMQMTVFTAGNDPAKIYLLSVRENSGTARDLLATFYVEWVLGVNRYDTQRYIVTGFEPKTGILSARNSYHELFRDQPAFIACSEPVSSHTGNRTGFFKDNAVNLSCPELDGITGAGLDPCGALRAHIHLDAGEEKKLVFLLGHAVTPDKHQELLSRFGTPEAAENELNRVRAGWEKLLNQIQVRTPDHSLDLITNGWLLYQVMACRILSRTSFYHCGG
ncbi:MAG TPA: hypothetical protein DD727_03365, partial [Clostridiales bacterium]|nr:hypothetical protein [Clostridiales bacterium]